MHSTVKQCKPTEMRYILILVPSFSYIEHTEIICISFGFQLNSVVFCIRFPFLVVCFTICHFFFNGEKNYAKKVVLCGFLHILERLSKCNVSHFTSTNIDWMALLRLMVFFHRIFRLPVRNNWNSFTSWIILYILKSRLNRIKCS